MYKQVTPVIDHSVRRLCSEPYSGNKNGCPNFARKEGCPPGAAFFDQVFDLSQPVFAIWNAFDFKGHVDRMKAAHPDWSDIQAKCCLYWQNGARKALSKEIECFLWEYRSFGNFNVAVAYYRGISNDMSCWRHKLILSPPEAMGVDIGKTMAGIGINIWPIVDTTYQIALAGIRKGD